MGWLFGCFGGGKKDRCHANAATAPIPKPSKKSSYPAPAHMPSDPIPIKAAPSTKTETYRDYLNAERQGANSAPMTRADGVLLQPKALAKEEKTFPGTDPWYQLNELEEELKDLSRQIARESEDAKKIRDEVNLLKTCGSFGQTSSEMKKRAQLSEMQQIGTSEKGSHPRFVAFASPKFKTHADKEQQPNMLRAGTCADTPAMDSHWKQAMQSPHLDKSKAYSNAHSLNQALPATTLASIGSSIPPVHNGMVHKHMLHQPTNVSKVDVLDSTSKPVSGCTPPSLDVDCTVVHNNRKQSDLSQRHPDRALNPAAESSPSGNSSDGQDNSSKKRRFGSVSTVQEQNEKKLSVGDVNVGEDNYYQKRLKVLPPANVMKLDMETIQSQKQMHTVESLKFPHVLKSALPSETSPDACGNSIPADFKGKYNPIKHRYQVTNDAFSVSESICQSTPTSDSSGHVDYKIPDSSNIDGKGKYLDESSCSSFDSEETISDRSPEQCFSPPMSPSYTGGGTCDGNYSVTSSCAGQIATTRYDSQAISQYSFNCDASKQSSWREFETPERTEDEYDSYADAASHVSTDFSEIDYATGKLEHNDSMDSLTLRLARLGGHKAGYNDVKTPLKLPEWPVTPKASAQGASVTQSRVRSKSPSSVLTPVENVSQWKQLKERDDKTGGSLKASITGQKSLAAMQMFEHTAQGTELKWRGENKTGVFAPGSKPEHGFSKAEEPQPILVDTSLSHWNPGSLKNVNGSLQRRRASGVDASLSHWKRDASEVADECGTTVSSEVQSVRVDTSLSTWLPAPPQQGRPGRSSVQSGKHIPPCSSSPGFANEAFWKDVNKSMARRMIRN